MEFRGPERQVLGSVKGFQPVDHDLLGDREVICQFGDASRPACMFCQVLETHQQVSGFDPDGAFNTRRLAAAVLALQMKQFVCECAAAFVLRECRVQPDAAGPVGGSGRVRVWARPDDCNVRERTQLPPRIKHMFEDIDEHR